MSEIDREAAVASLMKLAGGLTKKDLHGVRARRLEATEVPAASVVVSVESAQRRVLEAMAGMHGGLAAFAVGMRAMTAHPGFATRPAVVALYHALADLAEAVGVDLAEREESR